MRFKRVLPLVVVACASVVSSGCFWLAVGGAGVVGYEIAKDDRSIGTKVDDASVTSAVKAKLIRDGEIDALDINVDTYEGVVTLHGNVRSSDAKSRAEQLAQSVKGVKDVRSEILVIPPAN